MTTHHQENSEWENLMGERLDIPTWMRNFGVNDEDTFTAGEVQEMLESFWDDKTKSLRSLLSNRLTKEEVGEAIKENESIVHSPDCEVDEESHAGCDCGAMKVIEAFDDLRSRLGLDKANES